MKPNVRGFALSCGVIWGFRIVFSDLVNYCIRRGNGGTDINRENILRVYHFTGRKCDRVV